MKAVIAQVWPDVLERRKLTGEDRWDEIWEGVLHMAPMPNFDHQNFEWSLETWLRTFWAVPRGCIVAHNINLASIGGWPGKNYRIPDLVLLTPDRFHINHNEYFEGAPTAVVEIRSPDDESYEKLPFYAELGVSEVWIIDRDTRQPEIYSLAADGEYVPLEPSSNGWLASVATGIELRAAGNSKLAIRNVGDDETLRELP